KTMEAIRKGVNTILSSYVPLICLVVVYFVCFFSCFWMDHKHCPPSTMAVTYTASFNLAWLMFERSLTVATVSINALCIFTGPFIGVFLHTLARGAGMSNEFFDHLMDVICLSALAWSLPVFFAFVRPGTAFKKCARCGGDARGCDICKLTSMPSVLLIELPYTIGSFRLPA
ncbi:hypothetical protein PENTCL1PPCAC_3996, partial [Pristionchus entomophagus]